MSIKGKEIVEKKNILNEIKSNNMTLQELRFFSIYLSKINARNPESRKVRFPLKDFQSIMELGRINIEHMKSTTDSLLCKIVHIPTENGGYEAFQLFKKCKVDTDKNNEWFVEIDSHDDALPLFFEFKKNYFKYELWNALRLKSSNQLRMYETLKQYEKIGEREISLEQLRNFLGIQKNEYPRWNNFKSRVLDSCKEALEDNTDIKFTYEPIKRGRGGKTVAVRFNIKHNNDYVDELTLDDFIEQQNNEYVETISKDAHFKNKTLEFLSEACNNEFSENKIQVIYDIVKEIIPFKTDSDKTDLDRYDYLSKKYNEMNLRKPKKNRFGYLKVILNAELEV